MDINKIIVPKEVRYISDWSGYSLENYGFPHILDKVITGCGFTEYCLTNQQNVILCSPRKILLENKESQHPGEVFYAKNEILDNITFDRSFSSRSRRVLGIPSHPTYPKKEDPISEERLLEKNKLRIISLKNDIKNYCGNCLLLGKPIKILVTYDSFRIIKEAVDELGILSDFQIVIDEFQSVLVDAKFKSSTELDFLYQLYGLQKVCFVSATPMLKKYIERLEEFNRLPYYQFDWVTEDPGRITRPNLKVHRTKNIVKDVAKIIEDYKSGNFAIASWINDEGKITEIKSNEAVFYVNSVKAICNIIRKNKLVPENTNILCARTEDNEKKIINAFNEVLERLYPKDDTRRCRKGDVFGSIPKKGEPHKMFTLCTRTVYLGADFYSTCARTFIFSDSNIDCLCVDIRLDLPQILGRQRLDENPWKNSADMYVKDTILKLTREDLDRELKRKISITNNLIKSYNCSPTPEAKHDLANKYEKDAVNSAYKDDYIAVNHHAGSDLLPVFNKLMLVAEERAFDIQQVDYKDNVSIYNTLRSKGYGLLSVDKELDTFNSLSFFRHKMKYVCTLGKTLDTEHFNLFINSIPKEFKNFYNVLGPSSCGSCDYGKSEMEKKYNELVSNQDINIEAEIYKEFPIGTKIARKDIKEKLVNLYSRLGYKTSPKAKDLEKWFNIKSCLITNKTTGKRDNGFEILSKK